MSLKKIFEAVVGNKEKNAAHKQLIAAIRAGKTNTVLGMLDDGTDLNYKGGIVYNGGGNPLAACIDGGSAELFKVLLDHGADPKTTVSRSYGAAADIFTLLSKAIEDGRKDIAEILIDDPRIDVQDGGSIIVSSMMGVTGAASRKTPLELAEEKGMTDIADKIRARIAADKASAQPAAKPKAPGK